jgi:hypothetical protein
VLVVLIPTVLVASALLGLGMCRLAALSDNRHAVALADWIATTYLTEHQSVPADQLGEQLPIDLGDAFRVTG